ncbi:hypothetical protein [Plantactinospora sp. KLBMP9567]|uniref:hypothetical protein n=1 Tax=Plantactinospora sp. KLBMP9567 TaxID=3085900 RepID=UPI0029817D5E|nr:hypothetical protein [Plantactinospora sp. KLBMP9567]MDW5323481.1 hypothetical protein [Plantactinospora sp. KLBMP9567]
MRQQQTDNGDADMTRSAPVTATGPGRAGAGETEDRRSRYPEGTGDQGPDALDERGSYDNDLATSGSGPAFSSDPAAAARARDDRLGESRSADDRAEDAALDDDALPERSATDRTGGPDSDTGSTGDRGDLADASQADAAGGPDEPAAARTGTVYATTGADTAGKDAAGADAAVDPDATGKDATVDPDGTARIDGPERVGDADEDRDGARDGSGAPEFHEPAPLPTSFGAPTVGGAVAAAALAGSHRDPRNEDTVRSGDGPADDRIDGVGDERAEGVTRQEVPDRSLGAADAATATRTGGPADGGVEPDPPVDPLGRPVPEGSAVGVAHPVNPDVFSAGNPDALTGGTRASAEAGGRDETATTGETATTDSGRTADGGLPPGAAPAEPIVAILDQEAVQGFRDRWREVQLRFVDDPPAATEEAHRLVRESVEAVTAALSRQRDELAGWQDDGGTDTERLRMVVRRHRDFLDRLLGR